MKETVSVQEDTVGSVQKLRIVVKCLTLELYKKHLNDHLAAMLKRGFNHDLVELDVLNCLFESRICIFEVSLLANQ
jgi:hypothetical protein